MKKLIVALAAAFMLLTTSVYAGYIDNTYYLNKASSHLGYVEAYVHDAVKAFWLKKGAEWSLAPGAKDMGGSCDIVIIPNTVWNKHKDSTELMRLHHLTDPSSTVPPTDKYTVDGPDGKTIYTVPKGTKSIVVMQGN